MGKDTNSFSESFSLEDLEEIGIGLAGAKKEPVREANGCERSSPPTPNLPRLRMPKRKSFRRRIRKC